MKESPTRYVNPFLSDEENEKVNLWNDAKVNFATTIEDEKLGKSLAPHPNVPLDYIDKDVTECKLPELIACYDDSVFHVVKDICVDEGLSQEKKIEIDNELHKFSSDHVIVNGYKDDAMIADPEAQFSKDEQQLIQSPLEDCYKNTHIISVEEAVKLPSDYASDDLKLLVESNTIQSSEICGRDTSMQTDGAEMDPSPNSLKKQDKVLKTDKIMDPSSNDVDLKLSEVQSAGSEGNILNKLKMEENADSSVDNVKPETTFGPRESTIDVQTTPNHDMAPDNIAAVNQLQRGGGESSFSVADPVSGLITYSGPITSAGSISHRSDASNTSVRSFAFPILQNEWNSSPVRMAKVDQRRKGWRQALMCCGF
uniref:uncharacterized protein LOC122596414 n=1 Tax=Erigeron canadensis TaxID=72917 RepID=UPI001CB957D9|nr:uncharacterized protein LOC122596414 [Erigeron canadensis]XP_043624921.1 uncharacterized protein LOC122596414 [Erigeron canadensis]